MLLMIDNYDSFTYNLVQYFGELKANLKVYRNDALTLEQVRKMKPDRIVISPGPGRPEDAGITVEVIKELAGRCPSSACAWGIRRSVTRSAEKLSAPNN